MGSIIGGKVGFPKLPVFPIFFGLAVKAPKAQENLIENSLPYEFLIRFRLIHFPFTEFFCQGFLIYLDNSGPPSHFQGIFTLIMWFDPEI